jgi:hypothetical protein
MFFEEKRDAALAKGNEKLAKRFELMRQLRAAEAQQQLKELDIDGVSIPQTGDLQTEGTTEDKAQSINDLISDSVTKARTLIALVKNFTKNTAGEIAMSFGGLAGYLDKVFEALAERIQQALGEVLRTVQEQVSMLLETFTDMFELLGVDASAGLGGASAGAGGIAGAEVATLPMGSSETFNNFEMEVNNNFDLDMLVDKVAGAFNNSRNT